jgi:hypothetical protein
VAHMIAFAATAVSAAARLRRTPRCR